MKKETRHKYRRDQGAFSFVEVLVTVSLAGFIFLSLYAGFSSGFAVLQLARENLRGTQILQEKMETIRLYNWQQLTNPSFIPPNFVDTFYPGTQATSGIIYTGQLTIATVPMWESYSNSVRLITAKVQWVSGKALRRREMSTMVTRYGLQNYIY